MSSSAADGRLRWAQALAANAGSISAAEIMRRLDETEIGIVLGQEKAASLPTQVTALTAVNLLARLFRRLTVVVPSGIAVHDCLPFIAGEIGPALVSFATRVHRDVQTQEASVPPANAYTLYVAHPAAVQGKRNVHCRGDGWLVHVTRQPIILPPIGADPDNPIGPLLAAALGVAEIFKLVFADALAGLLVVEDVTFSALTYRVGTQEPGPALGKVGLPNTTLIGAGSIGSAFLWGLAHVRDISGRMGVLDHDVLKVHNPDRAILILDGIAEREPKKAPWACDMVAPWVPDLHLYPFDGTIRNYVDTLPVEYRLPLAISAVDSIESRRDVQDALPQHILNASTGPTQVDISRHGFADGHACLYCLYLPELLNRSPIQIAVERTGFPHKVIAELMTQEGRRLTADMVRGIENHNQLPQDTLRYFAGRSLQELLREIAYSQVPIQTEHGPALVTTAFVSAFAGFLLLAEVIKEALPTLALYRLNREYRQDLLGRPNEDQYWSRADPTGYCLCHDPFRRQRYAEKYDYLDTSKR